nr:hypothetical protein [Tanacetum cinerariifolium]
MDISSPFEELSDIGSPRADDHEHLMLPEMLEDPYVEVALQAPPSPDCVPGPEHADDEIVAEDQPYAEDASPIAQSPEYVPESDFEAHPEDDNDEDPEEDPIDYAADGGDDGDDEEESSEDEEDDEMDVEADEEEEEEHPAPADSVVVAPTAADQAPSAEETDPFETDESVTTPLPHPAYRTTARISIPAPVPMPAWTDSEVARLLAISSPPSSPLSLWSSPPPQIPFQPLPPILSPPSPILPSASRREDRPEVTLPPRKRLDIALGPRYEGAPISTDTELGGYVREFETRVRQDTNKIYTRLDDKHTERQLLAGRVNMLFRDRRAHAYTRQLMETEARMSTEAWVRATDMSDLVHGKKPMAPRRTTRSTADQETINATTVTNAQLQAMIDQGVTAALAARDALR